MIEKCYSLTKQMLLTFDVEVHWRKLISYLSKAKISALQLYNW